MAELTKVVSDELKSIDAMCQDIAVHGPGLASMLAAALEAPEVEQAALTVFRAAQLFAERKAAELQEADGVYLAEQADDARIRTERDNSARATYEAHLSVRETVVPAYGHPVLRELGYRGDTPRDPVNLDRLTPVTIAGLQKLASQPMANRRVLIDIPGLIEDLTEAHAPLPAAIKAATLDARENEAAMRMRNDSLQATTKARRIGRRLLATLAEVVGDDDLAGRVRDGTKTSKAKEKPAEPLAPPA